MTQPSFYQLLGLDPGEQNTQRIAEAANRAMARARSGRPGSRGAQWAKLLEEVTAAASCLSDPVRRAEYDRQLGRGGAARSYNRPAPRSRVVPTTGGSSAPNAVPLQGPASAALPMQAPQGFPAAYSQNPAGPAAYLDPMAPVVPAGPSAAAPGYGQAAPYGAAAMPSYPAPHGHPLPGAPAPVVSGYEYPAAASRRGVPGSVPAGSGTPVACAGKDRTSSAKVRQRDKISSVTVLAVSAGVGMVILAVAIVLIILSRKTEDRGRSTHDSFAQNRPIVNAPSPPPETFHRPTPTPRRSRTGERKIHFPAARNESGEGGAEAALSAAVGPGLPSSADRPLTATDRPSSVGQVPGQTEVLTEPTFGPPSGNPPVGSQPDVMSNPKSPTDNNLSLPAFPDSPKLPTSDASSPLPLTPTVPNEARAVPMAAQGSDAG